MPANLTLTGARELDAALRELSSDVANRLGENAVRAAARVVATAAKTNVPVRSGALRQSIRAFRDPQRRAGERTAYAGTRLFYGKFLEFGTSKMSAQPFLRPALDESGQAAVDKMTANLRAGINRVAVKHGGRADGPTTSPESGSDLDIFSLGFELGMGE